MRISGLASGFDTDEMVKQLMQAERIKVDRVEQNKQTMLWRQEQHNSINKQFANFILNTQKDLGLKRTSITGTLTNNSHKNVDYVKKATSSNEGVATVSNTGKVTNGSFEIKVGKEPINATFTSAKISDANLVGKKEITFMVNGRYLDVSKREDGGDLTMDDVVKAVNSAKTLNYNGVEISKETFNGLSDLEKKDVKETPLGVSAFYDKGTGRMFFESAEGGQPISITGNGKPEGDAFALALNGTGEMFEPGVIDGVTGKIIEPKDNQSISIAGTKGEVTINGISVDVENGKVNFNGLTIDIKSEGTTRINVSTNTEGIMEKIEKLVADYNDLVDMASGLVGEKRYPGYKPLSSEEKKAMTEDDVKLWEEKAKSGLLNKDETLNSVLQNMRTNLYKTLEGVEGFNHITQIGISTEKYNQGSAGGKLQIDTDKLRKAIEDDADGVMDLLFKNGNVDDDKNLGSSNRGVFTRVYDDLIKGMQSIVNKSGAGKDVNLFRGIGMRVTSEFVTKGSISDLDKSVTEMNRKIDNLNILLAKKEESHYAKFTAMEKNMYKMQNQSSWLAQQFM